MIGGKHDRCGFRETALRKRSQQPSQPLIHITDVGEIGAARKLHVVITYLQCFDVKRTP